MNIKTWLLGTAMLFSPSSQSVKATTDDTPKEPEKISIDMNTLQKKINQKLLKINIEKYKEDSLALEKEGKPKEQKIEFYYETIDNTSLGHYRPEDDVIVINNRFKKEKQDILPYILQHEKQHEIFDNKKMITIDGQDVPLKKVPMGLYQHYQLEQVNEIGAQIAVILMVRNDYINSQKELKANKNNVLSTIAQHPSEIGTMLQSFLNTKGGEFSKHDDKYAFSQNGNIIKIFDLAENKEIKKVMDAYIITKDSINKKINSLERNSDFSWYIKAIKESKIDPMANTSCSFYGEMREIGFGVASNWMKNDGKRYEEQCLATVRNFFGTTNDNLKDIKTNNANYRAAVQEALTIGGFDFSKDVLQCIDILNTNSLLIKKLKDVQVLIDANKSYKEIVSAAQELNLEDDVERYVSRQLLSKGKVCFTWNEEAAKNGEYLLAPEIETTENLRKIVRGKQIGDTVTLAEMKELAKEARLRSDNDKAFGQYVMIDAKTNEDYGVYFNDVREEYWEKDGFIVMNMYQSLLKGAEKEVVEIKKCINDYYSITKDSDKITVDEIDIQGFKNRMITSTPTTEFRFTTTLDKNNKFDKYLIDTTQDFLKKECTARMMFESKERIKQHSNPKSENASNINQPSKEKQQNITISLNRIANKNNSY